MGSFSITHWVILLIIVLLIFGTKKLKNIGEDLGGAVRGFKQGMKDDESRPVEPLAAPAESAKTIDIDAREKTRS